MLFELYVFHVKRARTICPVHEVCETHSGGSGTATRTDESFESSSENSTYVSRILAENFRIMCTPELERMGAVYFWYLRDGRFPCVRSW